jgi:dTDP-4-amino-4,6-dideoxygalactose transaminase
MDLRRRVEALRPALIPRIETVLAGGRFIFGAALGELEQAFARYCGVTEGVGVASGTDALWLALEALGVGPGDEVITAGNTCAPTIAAILQTGATPVLVDVALDTMTIVPALVEASMTRRTRCIVPVHLYGQCAPLGELRALCDRRGVSLVEDCAQAHGAARDGRRAGSVGDAGCFSFYPTKNLAALGDAGMIVTGDRQLADRLRLLRNYGYAQPNRSVIPGHNSRLDELQAAILLAGLERLDAWNARRRAIAHTYTEGFAGTAAVGPVEDPRGIHVYHLYVVRAAQRDALREHLTARGIETLIHYPVPVHRQDGYAKRCLVGHGGLPVTERLAAEIVSLPLYPELRDEEAAAVVAAVAAFPCR